MDGVAFSGEEGVLTGLDNQIQDQCNQKEEHCKRGELAHVGDEKVLLESFNSIGLLPALQHLRRRTRRS